MFNLTSNSSSDMATRTLPYYESVDDLSLKLVDIANIFVLPFLCAIGIVLNLASIFVILKLTLKTELYQFMFLNSFVDLLFFIFSIFMALVRCGRYCSLGYTYLSKIYELYIYLYVGNVLLMFITLLNLFTSFNRLISFSKLIVTKPSIVSFRIKLLVLLLISIVSNLPNYVLTRNVIQIGILRKLEQNSNNSTVYSAEGIYSVESIKFSLIGAVKAILFIINLARGFLLMIILFILNVMIAVKLKLHLNRKSEMLGKVGKKSSIRNSLIEQKSNLLILVFGTIYLIGNGPNSIAPFLFNFNDNGHFYKIYLIFGNFMLYIVHSSNFILFYLLNNPFRKCFDIHFNKIFRRN